MVKSTPAMQETQVRYLVRDDQCRSEWLLTPVFLPGEVHGQRSLVGYSPWRCTASNTTDLLTHTREREHELAQSCPTLCNPMDCSLPGSSVHGIF